MKTEDKASWSYSPKGGDDIEDEQVAPLRAPTSTKSFNWQASEYIDHKQGPAWFAALTAATIVIAAIIFLFTRDYFAVVITALLGVIVGVFARRTPKLLEYQLDQDGLSINDKNYPYSIFKSFSIIQDGPLISISLNPLKRLMPPVSAYFAAQDQPKIIAILEDELPYEEKQLDGVERLTRRLRF